MLKAQGKGTAETGCQLVDAEQFSVLRAKRDGRKAKIPGGYLHGQPLLHRWSMSHRGSAGGAAESDIVNRQQPGHCLCTVTAAVGSVVGDSAKFRRVIPGPVWHVTTCCDCSGGHAP